MLPETEIVAVFHFDIHLIDRLCFPFYSHPHLHFHSLFNCAVIYLPRGCCQTEYKNNNKWAAYPHLSLAALLTSSSPSPRQTDRSIRIWCNLCLFNEPIQLPNSKLNAINSLIFGKVWAGGHYYF